MTRAAGRSRTTGELAIALGAVCEGPTDRVVDGVAPLDAAEPNHLSFCRGGRWTKALAGTRAGAVLVGPDLAVPDGVVALRVRDPRYAYAIAASALVPLHWPDPERHPRAEIAADARVADSCTIEPFAVIRPGAEVGEGTWIQAHCYVGRRAHIGRDCRLMPGSVVMDGAVLGDRVWLHPGAVVGDDGFGHVIGPDGPIKVPQLGSAVLEDDVEVGANACVDRAALNETRIGRGTRLDNLVQVAHGVRIGTECLLAAFAGVAGGARLGDRVVMGGRTAVVDGIEVGDGAIFAGLASASRDVPPGAKIGGSPARSYARWLKEVAGLRALPAALKQLERVERRLQALEGRHDGP
ncbi:MAG: UDP-3-O-(3-hydroxymyristoyl)glucosamine N-acyltransferase [Myxococcales bacterium]|nr:UDP-3-O-(3-hydroxymyristoyl)glucosamine N-acyltransferase [Myxococcales bacterium]